MLGLISVLRSILTQLTAIATSLATIAINTTPADDTDDTEPVG